MFNFISWKGGKLVRTVLVTGGTRGIGASIAIAFKDAGYSVAANYASNDEEARKFEEENGIPVFKFDAGNYQGSCIAVEEVKIKVGPVDVLVNNAGITRDAPLHKMEMVQWSEVLRTNLDSCFNLSSAVINDMRERHFGRIINVSSINGQKGQFGQTNYAAAKAGMIGFTKALALENASKGVTVNAVAPGYIGTDMVRAIPEEIINEHILPQIPAGRLGEPIEVARCVIFLASDEAAFINGSTLTVNGGQYLI